MTISWLERTTAAGLSEESAALAARSFALIEEEFHSRFPSAPPPRAWWVPGRIEVLGKHTDYGGGRSLLAAVERGFHWLASPVDEPVVELVDADTGAVCRIPLSAEAPHRPGEWMDYPISVVRRVARDVPGASRGMQAIFRSSLPRDAGLSSSSALVVATFLPLAEFNTLPDHPAWRQVITDADALAGYLGAVENGRAFGPFPTDHGVGTQGGSEDHTAVLRCEPGRLSQYRFLPVAQEQVVSLPDGWTFAIGVSGVHAPKAGAVRDHYNHLSGQLAALLRLWNEIAARQETSLLDALRSGPEAFDTLDAAVRERLADPEPLAERLVQFRDECIEIIPEVTSRIAAGDVRGIGPLVAQSQHLATTTLRNQVPETIVLVESARRLGAAAASAFGAGFGGSVWALVETSGSRDFQRLWREAYHRSHPGPASHAEFFLTRPGPAAGPL